MLHFVPSYVSYSFIKLMVCLYLFLSRKEGVVAFFMIFSRFFVVWLFAENASFKSSGVIKVGGH